MGNRICHENTIELIAFGGLTEKEFTESLSGFSPEELFEFGEWLQKLRCVALEELVRNAVN